MVLFWFLWFLAAWGHECSLHAQGIRQEWSVHNNNFTHGSSHGEAWQSNGRLGPLSLETSVSAILMPFIVCAKNHRSCQGSNTLASGIEWMTFQRTDLFQEVRHQEANYGRTHINYTLNIHFSGIFFAWHRQYVWLWEKALREECGYQGYQPYWNWALSAANLSASPLFDGSDTSLSGDGDPLEGRDPMMNLDSTNLTIPNGSGGGCVNTGPFAGMTLNLPDLASAPIDAFPDNAFAYTPRCLTRDLNSYIAQHFTNQTDVDRLLGSPDIVSLQHNMDVSAWPGFAEAGWQMGPHVAGHIQLGRAMQDFWTAPQEPAFMLHHAMVDRVWTLWQAQEPDSRQYALNGTSTIHNAPTTPDVTLDTQLTWGVLGKSLSMREVMSTEAYEYCYTYGN